MWGAIGPANLESRLLGIHRLVGVPEVVAPSQKVRPTIGCGLPELPEVSHARS